MVAGGRCSDVIVRGGMGRLVPVMVLVTCLAAVVGPALAAEPPAPAGAGDLFSAATLTAEQAARLVREQQAKPRFPVAGDDAAVRGALEAAGATANEIDRLTTHGDRFFSRDKRRNPLRWITGAMNLNLSDMAEDEVGRQRLLLAHHEDYQLTANRFADFLHLGLTEIPPDVADALSGFTGSLCLPRLKRLESAPLATTLGRQKLLVLRGVESIGDAAAGALAAGTAHIEAPFLKTLDSEPLARNLSARKELALPSLTAISPGAAAGLAAGQGTIVLQSMREISLAVARPLAASQALFRLGWPVLTPEVAEILSRGPVRLEGVSAPDSPAVIEKLVASGAPQISVVSATLSEASARALAKYKGRVDLHLVTSLSPEAASALAAVPGELECRRLTALKSVPLAEKLATQGGPVTLAALEAIDTPDAVAIATKLATKQGPLAIPKLKRLSPKTLSALLEKQDVEIPLIADLELINEPDGSPTDDFVIPPGYEERQSTRSAPGR